MRITFHFIDSFLKYKLKIGKLKALLYYNFSKIGVAVADTFNQGTSFSSIIIGMPLHSTSSYHDSINRNPSRGEQKFRDFMTSS